MFCSTCGAQTPADATYCHKCGAVLYQESTGVQQPPEPYTTPVVPQLTDEQRQFVEELLPIDQKPNECHACGRTENLNSWAFGLAKKTRTKRDWVRTAASIGLSAVTLPLLGSGALALPGNETHYRVLRLQLILCDSCRARRFSYGIHPWWETARRLGYKKFFDAKKLNKLQTAR